jgi:uncharacterized membrane protein
MKRSIITTIAAVVVGVGLTSTAFAAGPWGHRGAGHRHPLAASIFMGVVVAAIVGLIVYLIVRRPSASHAAAQPTASPTASGETILAERLARGEISPDDYRTMLAALKGIESPASSS